MSKSQPGMKGPGRRGGPGNMNFEKAKDTRGTLARVWEYMRIYKLQLILVVIFIILNVVCNTLSTITLSPIIDKYIAPMIKDGNISAYMHDFIKMLIVLLLLAIGTGVFEMIQMKLMITVSQNTVKKMRTDLFAKIEKLPVKYFDENQSGSLMSRITNDLDNVSVALNTSVNQIIAGILTMIATTISMIIISPFLTLICILSIPIVLFVVSKITKIVRKQFVKQQECLANVNGYIEEFVSGQKVVKAFNKEEKIKEDFNKLNETLKNEGFKAQAYSSVVMPITGSLNNMATAVTCVISGILAINGKISIGSITAFNKFARHFSQPINEISQQFNVIQSGLAGAERMFEIIDQEVEFPDNNGKEEIGEVKGKVEFKNVYFGYEEDKMILKDINLVANPGQTIAIVGPTGAGKTTIINLLTRFYDVNKGEILIDGVNIKDVNIHSLRNTLGIVLQDTVLFSEKVKDNIRFGKLDATEDEIKEAAKIANAHSFIKRLPEGYETTLAEDATNISVGQRQLLNISRVVLNDPDILILDEATSNVDTRTEVKIQEAMNKLLEGRTSFVIAHRLSTIRKADNILVIYDGQIVEQGNHEQLISKKGKYYDMYNGMFENAEEIA